MPKLRMPPGQQTIYDDLVEYTAGARMIDAALLAQFWGRDVRCVREWARENAVARYKMGHGYSYQIRDVARAVYLSMEQPA